MNCFRMKKWWALKETHNPCKIGLENWNLGLWEKIIVLKWVIVFIKVNIFRSLELQWSVSVSGKCLWLVFFSYLRKGSVDSWSDCFGGKGGYGYTQKRLHVFLRWVLLASFHSKLKSLSLGWFSIWQIFWI